MKLWFLYILVLIPLIFFPKIIKGEESDEIEYNDDRGDCPCETEIYEKEQEHGIIKSPHYPNFGGCNGRCIYKILPHPNKSVALYTSQFEISNRASLTIYSLLEQDGQQVRIPHAKVRRPKNYYYSSAEQSFPGFVSAKNAGFEVHFVSHTEEYYTSFKISFDRNYEHDEVCDYPIVEVGFEETVVQRDHYFRASSGCVYMLKPKITEDTSDEDEVIINIGESDENLVSVRVRDENGNPEFGELSTKARSVLTSAYNVQILTHKTSRTDGKYKMAKVTAQLVKKSCECGPNEYSIDIKNQSTITVRSPGWPDLYCPNRACSYSIIPWNYQYDDDKVGILEVEVKAVLGQKDTFLLKSDAKEFIESSIYKGGVDYIVEKFVIKQQSLSLDYQSNRDYNKRYFEVNVTQIMINPECSCTFYKDKKFDYVKPIELQIDFPSHCTYIYCNFQLTVPSRGYRDGRSLLDFQVNGAVEGDRVIIADAKHEEKYEGTMLHRKKRYEAMHSSEFTFYREHLESNETTVLFFNWTHIDNDKSCDGQVVDLNVDIDNPLIITSPGYPQRYDNDQTCQFIIHAPDNCRLALSIDEISLENFHDHLRIYEGNTTEGNLLKVYTNHVLHQVLNITTSPILIVFQADQSNSDRGFHITATAHVMLDSPDEPSNTFTYILIALVLVLIIALLFVLYFYEKHFGGENPAGNVVDRTTDVETNGNTIEARNGERQQTRVSNIDYIFE